MGLRIKQNTDIIKFIRKLFKKPNGIIPLHEPVFVGNERKYLLDCIDSTFISGRGKYIDLFEKKAAELADSKFAISIINGTSALHLGLILLNVKPGDEVITQAFTYIAPSNAISYCGAKPVFIDINRETLGMSPEKLNHFLKNNTKVKRLSKSKIQLFNKSTKKPITAVLPVHVFGHPCHIKEIVEICNTFDLPVIEDAAESIGSKYMGRHTGTYGTLGIQSFNGNKTVTTGGGGIILTNEEQIYARAKHLRSVAKKVSLLEYEFTDVGYNYTLPNILAAIGLAQLENLSVFVDGKRELSHQYRDFFDELEVVFFTEPPKCYSNYWLNSILFQNIEERDSFIIDSNKNEIISRPAWPLLNRLKIYENCFRADLSDSQYIHERIVNIPSSYIPGFKNELST